MRQWQPPAGSRVPYCIVFEMGLKKDPKARSLLHQAKECKTRLGSRMGSWSQKGISFFFFQNLSFFGMPLREQGVPRTSGAKTKQGEFFDFWGGNPLIAY